MGWLWQRTQRTQKRVSSVAVGVQAGAQVTSGQGRDVITWLSASFTHRGPPADKPLPVASLRTAWSVLFIGLHMSDCRSSDMWATGGHTKLRRSATKLNYDIQYTL